MNCQSGADEVLGVPATAGAPSLRMGGICVKITRTPAFLDALLRAEVLHFLESKSEIIADEFDDARQSYLDSLMPLWNAHLEVNNAVEEWYSGNVGNRRLIHLSEYVTINMAMLVPEYLRSNKVANITPEEVKDQVPNMHHKLLLSKSTGIPFPLLMPSDIEENGDVTEIHELITEAPAEGKAMLTEWGTAALLALQQEGIELPDELTELISLPDSLA